MATFVRDNLCSGDVEPQCFGKVLDVVPML